MVVCDSWWVTRSKQGVHVLNPTQAGLLHAMHIAWLAGTNTVYSYQKLPRCY